jgi:tetratricopeptide (TPR) repeat protein
VVVIGLVYLLAAWLQSIRPLHGPFVNPNYFASFLLVGVAVCTAGVLFSQAITARIAAALAGLTLLYGIGQTSSRGAFVSLLVLLAVALFRTARRYRIAWWRIAIVGILIAVISTAANPSTVQKFFDRGQHDVYNYERTQIWMKTLSMISTHPVVGVGMGRFYYVSKLFTPAVDGAIGRYRRWPNIAHSEYLQYAAELGIPAALLMFIIGAYLFRNAWRRAETVAEESRVVQEAAILAAVGLGIHGLVDNNWTVPVTAAGLAVIGLADLLPYQQWPLTFRWTPVKQAALAIFIVLVFIQAVKVPALGLYFNEAGHQAFVAGNFERAEQMHRLGLGFAPDHPVMLDNLGMVYFDGYIKTQKRQYLDRAESLFRDSMAANPNFDIPAGHLETVLFQRLTGNARKDQPIHALIVSADQLGLRANPYNPFIRKNLAEALYNLGQKQEALEELKKSVELEPNFVQGYLRLAQWEEESGNSREAAEYRNKANDVVIHYKDRATTDPFEALLLDRPAASTGKP